MWMPRWLQDELAYSDGRMHAAARFTLSVCLVIAVGQWLRLPNYYWGLITVCVLVLPTAGAVLAKSFLRMIGTGAAALISVGLLNAFVQQHIAFTLAMGFFFVVLLYYAAGKYAPYAFLICTLTIVVIIYATVHDPTQVDWKAPTRAFEISVGVGVVAFVTLTFWPHFALDELRDRYAASLRTLADLHDCAWQQLREARPGLAEFNRLRLTVKGNLLKRAKLLEDAVWEDPSMEIRRGHMEVINFHLSRLFALCYHCENLLENTPPEALHLEARQEVEALERAVAAEFRRYADAASQRRTGSYGADLPGAVGALRAKMASPEFQRRAMDFSTGDNLRSVTYMYGLIETAETLRRIQEEHRAMIREEQRATILQPIWRIFRGWWEETVHFQPGQFHKAAVAAAVNVIIFVAGQSGYLGSSVLSAVAATIIIMWPSVGGGILNAMTIVISVLLGALMSFLALGMILPHVHTLGWLLVGMAPLFFLAGYLLAGPPTSYLLGLFTGIIISSTCFQGFAPPMQLSGFSETIGGIISGAIFGITAQLCFLPRSAHRQVAGKMAAFFRSLHARLSRLHKLDDLPPEPDPASLTHANQESLELANSLTALNFEARFELERHAIPHEHIEELQDAFRDLLLTIISLESLSYEPMDWELLKRVRGPGLELKERCLDLLESFAAFASGDGKVPFPQAELEQMLALREPLLDAIHEARSLCREHNYSQRPYIATLTYLEHLNEFAHYLQQTSEVLWVCFPQAFRESEPHAVPS